MRRSTIRSTRWRWSFALHWGEHPRGQGLDVDEDRVARRRHRQGGNRAGVTDRVGVRAGPDARRVLTPQLRLDSGNTLLLLVDLGDGRNRLGGSTLAQVYGQMGDVAPDLDDARLLQSFFAVVQALHAADKLLAYHDRSDGGLFAALSEMAFASRCGLAVELGALPGSPLESLFNEELGAVLQIHEADKDEVIAAFTAAGLRCESVGKPTVDGQIRIGRNGEILFDEPRIELHRAWSNTSHAMQRLRDNPESADQEFERLLDDGDPGLSPHLTFDAADDIAAPYIAKGARPKIAVLREQGVNGQVEIAAAFDRAGFDAFDVQ